MDQKPLISKNERRSALLNRKPLQSRFLKSYAIKKSIKIEKPERNENSFANNDRKLKTAPSSPMKTLKTANSSPNKLSNECDSNENKRPGLKRPQLHSRSSCKIFMAESLHVTGYESSKAHDFEVPADFSEQNLSTTLSFSSYNTKILNYRLFKSPTLENLNKRMGN